MGYTGKRTPKIGDVCRFENGTRVVVTDVNERPGRYGYPNVGYRLDDGRTGNLFYSEFYWDATPEEHATA